MLENLKSRYGNLQLKKEASNVERVRKNPDFQSAESQGLVKHDYLETLTERR